MAHVAGFPFRNRPPSLDEMERLRLTLSTFRDGTGQNLKDGQSYPGWRDFERATAAALGGIALESKAVFDVLMPVPGALPYGLSLKTSDLRPTMSHVRMELTNANAALWRRLALLGIDPSANPDLAGNALVELIEEWHLALAGQVDIGASSYVVLTHSPNYADFRLFWFDLNLRFCSLADIDWTSEGKRIAGRFKGKLIWEWYGFSGGQVKYYPLFTWAKWDSGNFALSVPPLESPADRAKRYWPLLWP